MKFLEIDENKTSYSHHEARVRIDASGRDLRDALLVAQQLIEEQLDELVAEDDS